MDNDINYIIHEAINGDKKFREELLLKLRPLIYKNIYKYYEYSDPIVEDLLQEGYIIILKSLDEYDKNNSVHFLGYIKMNIEFFVKNYYRHTKKDREQISLNKNINNDESDLTLEDLIVSNEISMEERVEKQLDYEAAMHAINKLSKIEQDILNLYFQNNLSIKEISEKLNIPSIKVTMKKYKALCKLKKLLIKN